MRTPLILQIIGTAAGLTRAGQHRLWQALSLAEWSRARDFRQRILLFEASPRHHAERFERFLLSELAPSVWVSIAEELHKEGVLSRAEATALQDVFLSAADISGGWKVGQEEEQQEVSR